jgi:hypothetical protein
MSKQDASQPLAFTKLDAARRQLNTAIWLWFNGADIVSVYTLAATAHRTILEVAGAEEVGPMPFNTSNLPDDVTLGTFKQAPNLLTGEADPDKVIHLKPVWVEFYLFFVASAYTEFAIDDDSYHPLMSAFMLRVGICRPEVFKRGALPKFDKALNVEKMKKLSKSEFLREMFGNIFPPPP